MKKRKQKKRKRKQYTQHNKLKVPNEPVWVKSRGLTVFLGHILCTDSPTKLRVHAHRLK